MRNWALCAIPLAACGVTMSRLCPLWIAAVSSARWVRVTDGRDRGDAEINGAGGAAVETDEFGARSRQADVPALNLSERSAIRQAWWSTR